MNDREKADLIRDRLMGMVSGIIQQSHHVDLVMRINGKDVRYEFDWVKPLLKEGKQ